MLVNCVAYREGHKVADILVDQISNYLDQKDCFVWVALKDPDDIELETMRREFNLHELAVEDARKGHQRPKIEEYGTSIFAVLHTIEFQSKNQEFSIGEIDIFAGKNYILSIRNQTKEGFASVRQRCEREPELLKHGSAFVLYALMDTVVDRYFPIIDKIEWELEQIEDRIFSRSSSARLVIEEIYTLKRRIMILQHTVTSLLDALAKLYGGRVPPICNGMQEYFRDVSDHVLRISKSIESIREMTTTAIQVNLSLISLGESEVTKKLASYGALFALPTSIAGIYGMNFKHMPELEWTWGYPLIVFSMVLANILLWRRFRSTGWL